MWLKVKTGRLPIILISFRWLLSYGPCFACQAVFLTERNRNATVREFHQIKKLQKRPMSMSNLWKMIQQFGTIRTLALKSCQGTKVINHQQIDEVATAAVKQEMKCFQCITFLHVVHRWNIKKKAFLSYIIKKKTERERESCTFLH